MSKVTVLDGFYSRESWMYEGGWKSYERGVRVGDSRLIDEKLCHCWAIHYRMWPFKHEALEPAKAPA
jgi:hypothetical protein